LTHLCTRRHKPYRLTVCCACLYPSHMHAATLLCCFLTIGGNKGPFISYIRFCLWFTAYQVTVSVHIQPVKWEQTYEAYSDSKYRFAVKKSIKVSYKILLLSDSAFFKLFFHIFAAIIQALIIARHKFLYTLLIECGHLRC